MKLTDAEREALVRALLPWQVDFDRCPHTCIEQGDYCGGCTYGANADAAHIASTVERIVADRLAQQREALAAAIEKGYLGADFGRSYDGQESPDARLHHAYDEGLEEAARIVREYQPGEGT